MYLIADYMFCFTQFRKFLTKSRLFRIGDLCVKFEISYISYTSQFNVLINEYILEIVDRANEKAIQFEG